MGWRVCVSSSTTMERVVVQGLEDLPAWIWHGRSGPIERLPLTRTLQRLRAAGLRPSWEAADQVLARLRELVEATGSYGAFARIVEARRDVVRAICRGQRKPSFTPYLDTGDHVIVVNASKVHLTSRKLDQKVYYSYSGYPGGLKETGARSLLEKAPERVVYHAVKGMLPRTRLGRAMLKKLRVYAGPDHPHGAQQPEPLALVHTQPRSGG